MTEKTRYVEMASERTITDGYAIWHLCEAKQCGLEVVRPGKVQCWCDGLSMPATDVGTLAESAELDVAAVGFIVGVVERREREKRAAETPETP